MKISHALLLVILMLLVMPGCRKEKEECYDVYTNNGSMNKTVCDLTETLIKNVYGKYYDLASAPKFCWKVTYPTQFAFVRNLSEKMAGIFFADAIKFEKVGCEYCQEWTYQYLAVSKVTGRDHMLRAGRDFLCGDTCATLFPGRKVVVSETADSLYVVWYQNKAWP